MNQAVKNLEQAEAVRRRTLSALKGLTEKAEAFELPAPLDALDQYRQKLEDNTYQVLVVGEAKRGKSTFVNALIGRDLLPTDVDIATSQVFRVCPAEREAYRLRFEDGSQMAITAADLPRYGSQVLAEAEGVPRLDQIIRWIEVDGPVSFLPANVRVLDTPGLGALYAAHAQITHRFVPHADAVIFVLESQAPISEPEIKFVEMILEATPNVLFVQTKIDQFRKEAWPEIQKRNEEILRQRFKDRLADVRVWPISSVNLRKAAQTGDDDLLLVSRHKELAAALQAFLFRVAGWSRSAQAVFLADRYHAESRTALEQRLNNLVEESREKRAETQRLALERRRQFDADWGERGQKRRELLEKIQKISLLGKQHMRQLLQPDGDIGSKQQAMIDGLLSLEAVSQHAQTLPAVVASSAVQSWRETVENSQQHCSELLLPFLGSVQALAGPEDAGIDTLGVRKAAIPIDESWLDKARVASGYSTAASTVIGGWATILALTGVVAPPVAIAVGAGAALFGWMHGWRSAERTQLKAAKQELSRHLASLIRQVHKHFLDVNEASGRFSLVDEHFHSFERSLTEQIDKLVAKKSAEAQAEMDRLTEQAKLNDEQRKIKAEQLRKQLTEWHGLGQEIKAIQFELRELERVPTSKE